MTISRHDVEQIAHLARLAINEETLNETTRSLGDVLNLVNQLQNADTDGVEPMAHPMDAVQRLREDVVTEHNQQEQLLKNAPLTEQGLFLVPRVVD
ncbi:MAG: Asp-tRNA(Asn)/Glu-tRNA(Gln) amidotransferase subunit GatC [Pseudomonadales bacterium]|nr:Asp-tRNA(Asn)/Glu-tRNA(Gln) amidotransferase subunit GatC [Pseudomonadales bacterium]